MFFVLKMKKLDDLHLLKSNNNSHDGKAV